MSFARLKLTLDAVPTEFGFTGDARDFPLKSQFDRNVPGSVSFFKSVETCKAGATAAERRTPTSWGG